MNSINALKDIFDSDESRTISILRAIDGREYDIAKDKAKNAIEEVENLKKELKSESDLNAAYLTSSFYELLLSVSSFWLHIECESYYQSWWALQDGLDHLRQLKKFYSRKNKVLSFFEKQLIELEKLYPYKLFSSPGFIVESFQCSICKNDIDSELCSHMKGELYSGEIAYAVAQEIKDIDHFAFVTNPTNKRLVIDNNDKHTQFNLFKEVVEHFNSNNLSPLGFSTLKRYEFMRPDEDWIKLPRNSECYCGSGKKFKKCCIDNSLKKQIHVDFMGHHIFA